MDKYAITIFWSEDDQVFVAEAPELPGCTAHGDDRRTALANCQDAIQHWIETAEEMGQPVPEPKDRPLRPA